MFFIFGVAGHALFLVVFAYMAAFVGNFVVPKTIDSPQTYGSVTTAVLIDLGLLAAFCVPHSVMARPGFKRWWTTLVPSAIERSVYVLVSNLLMILLLVLWRPVGPVFYDLQSPVARWAMWGLFATGWLLVPAASLMISHFDLFGTRQVWLNLQQKAYTHLPFHTPMLYSIIRHPLYVGWMISFWATPTMSAGHVIFATFMTLYMLTAIPIEERDLIAAYGETYLQYRRRVPALIPGLKRRSIPSTDAAPNVQLDAGA
jgi:protein-S-isoprenylcysteine O-methyltransferase Ste14